MKSASSITLSKAWWKKEAPDGLKRSAPAFEKALVEYEKAEGGLNGSARGEVAAKAVEKALDGLASAGKQVAGEAKDLAKKEKDKKRKADLANTEAVMGKPLSKEIASVRAKTREMLEAAEAAAEDGASKDADDEDEDAGAFGSAEDHAAYIKKWAPKLKRRAVSFALGLPSNAPEEMRFHFHLKKAGRGLASKLKKEAGAKKFTFGKAGTDELADAVDGGEEVAGRTLCLYLEGRRIPGLAKRVKVMLKKLGVSAFGRVKILIDGEEVDGAAEHDEDETLDEMDLDTGDEEDDLASEGRPGTAVPHAGAVPASPAPAGPPEARAPQQPEPDVPSRTIPRSVPVDRPMDNLSLSVLADMHLEGLSRTEAEARNADPANRLQPAELVATDEDAAAGFKVVAKSTPGFAPKSPEDVARADSYIAGLPKDELDRINAEADQVFWETTGYKPGELLDPADPNFEAMAAAWKQFRADLANDREDFEGLPEHVRTLLGFGPGDPVPGPQMLAALMPVARKLAALDRVRLLDLREFLESVGVDSTDRAALIASEGWIDWFSERLAEGETLEDMLDRLKRKADEEEALDGLAERSPKADAAARDAIAAFDEELGLGADVSPAAVAALEAEAEAARKALEAALEARRKADELPAGTPDEIVAREAALSEAERQLSEAEAADSAAGRRLTAAKGKSHLLDALKAGALAPGNPRPLDDAVAAKIVKALADHPELASHALATARVAPDPEAMAEAVEALAERVSAGFPDATGALPPDPFDATAYAKTILTQVGEQGPSYLTGVLDYVDRGLHRTPDPAGDALLDEAGRERARREFMAGAAMGSDGKLDPTGASATDALAHLKFSPDIIDQPTPMLSRHAEETLAVFADPATGPRAQAVLDGTTAPGHPNGKALVAASVGKPAGDEVTDADARAALLNAMFAPPYQSNVVGSCFATAGVRRQRLMDPIASMEKLSELASTGIFTPANGDDPIPANLIAPPDEDPLLRSLEFSAATVAGRSNKDSMDRGLGRSNRKALGALKDAIGSESWLKDRRKIKALLEESFEIHFISAHVDPVTGENDRDDRYSLIQTKPARREIRDRNDYSDAMTELVLSALEIDPASEKGKSISAAIRGDAFRDAVRVRHVRGAGGAAVQTGDFDDDFDFVPWKLDQGNEPDVANEVLFGGDYFDRKLIREYDSFKDVHVHGERRTSETQRSEDLLVRLTSRIDTDRDMVPVDSFGDGPDHAFNALPNDPSLAPFRGSKTEVREAFERELAAPGREISKTPLPQEQAVFIFSNLIDDYIAAEPDAADKTLLEAAKAKHMPAGPMLPSEIYKAMETVVIDLLVEEWRQEESAKGSPPSEVDIEGKRGLFEAFGVPREHERALKRTLATELQPPHVVIADPNFGDGTSEQRFVLAPDPVSGEVSVWVLDLPSGVLIPERSGWVDNEWGQQKVRGRPDWEGDK